jgi:hypothetical protein
MAARIVLVLLPPSHPCQPGGGKVSSALWLPQVGDDHIRESYLDKKAIGMTIARFVPLCLPPFSRFWASSSSTILKHYSMRQKDQIENDRCWDA